MLHRTCALATIAFTLFLLVTSEAAAGVQRTFVASNGNDANPCSLTMPCRGFAAAMSVVAAAGEVIVLDSAGYGSFVITKSVFVIAPPGVYAGISVFPGLDGVTVNAADTDTVTIRGLTINGQGGSTGIKVIAGGETHIEDCNVSNLIQTGIEIVGGLEIFVARTVVSGNGFGSGSNYHGLDANGGDNSNVHVFDSRFAGNAGHGVLIERGSFSGSGIRSEGNRVQGLSVQVGSAGPPRVVSVALSDSVLAENGKGNPPFPSPAAGFYIESSGVGATVNAAAIRVTSSNNTGQGFEANCSGGGTASMAVYDSAAVANALTGIGVIGANCTVNVTGNISAQNADADLYQSLSSIMRTSANNSLTGRGAPDVSGTLTPNPPQ